MAFFTKLLRFWFFAVFLILSVWFALSNQERYGVSFKPWVEHVSLPAWMIVTSSFVLGAVLASLALGADSMRKSMEIRRLAKALRDLQATSAAFHPATGTGPVVIAGDPRL